MFGLFNKAQKRQETEAEARLAEHLAIQKRRTGGGRTSHAWGAEFQTCSFVRTNSAIKERYFKRAQMRHDRTWQVMTVREREADPEAGGKPATVIEIESWDHDFYMALHHLIKFELTEPSLVGVQACDPAEAETLKWKHCKAFARREGILFDVEGYPHETHDGTPVTAGTFTEESLAATKRDFRPKDRARTYVFHQKSEPVPLKDRCMDVQMVPQFAGREFRTCTMSRASAGHDDAESQGGIYMKAIAREEGWDIVLVWVDAAGKLNHTEGEKRKSFLEAVDFLSEFEQDCIKAEGLDKQAYEREKQSLGTQHYEECACREMVVFDVNGQPHATYDGSPLTNGTFMPEAIERTKKYARGNMSALLYTFKASDRDSTVAARRSKDGRSALWGCVFRTLSMAHPEEPGISIYKKAVLNEKEDKWDIYLVREKQDGTMETRKDNARDYFLALDQLAYFESVTAVGKGYSVVNEAQQLATLGAEHYRVFGAREGVIFDTANRPHETRRGEIVTQGEFSAEARQLLAQHYRPHQDKMTLAFAHVSSPMALRSLVQGMPDNFSLEPFYKVLEDNNHLRTALNLVEKAAEQYSEFLKYGKDFDRYEILCVARRRDMEAALQEASQSLKPVKTEEKNILIKGIILMRIAVAAQWAALQVKSVVNDGRLLDGVKTSVEKSVEECRKSLQTINGSQPVDEADIAQIKAYILNQAVKVEKIDEPAVVKNFIAQCKTLAQALVEKDKKSVLSLVPQLAMSTQNVGDRVGGKGIYAGTWSEAPGKQVFDVYVAPEDLNEDGSRLLLTFNSAVRKVGWLRNWFDRDGTVIENHHKLQEHIDKKNFAELKKWFIPPLSLLQDNICKYKEKGALRDTFAPACYWSSTEYKGASDCAWNVNFAHNGNQGWDGKDRVRFAVRPVFLEPHL